MTLLRSWPTGHPRLQELQEFQAISYAIKWIKTSHMRTDDPLRKKTEEEEEDMMNIRYDEEEDDQAFPQDFKYLEESTQF